MKKLPLLLAAALLAAPALLAADHLLHTFRKQQLTDEFWSEGAYIGDFNHDGRMDVESGPFWYAGPAFTARSEFYPATTTYDRNLGDGKKEKTPGFPGARSGINGYSDNFLSYVHDFNADGWDDILVYGFPGKEAFWYENPKGAAGPWPRHVTLASVDNESPAWGDLTGDGKPEIICMSGGFVGYGTGDWTKPTEPWTFHKISPKGPYQRYTHGLGFGDVNGDGRPDILEKDGWWEQPAKLDGDPEWKQHKVQFAPTGPGCAQTFAYDVDGDGLSDVITCLNPHGYGLAWWQQKKERAPDGEIVFEQHIVLPPKIGTNAPPLNKYGVRFSQLHGLDLVDIDGDGLKDIVTGKRFWAHGPKGDEEPDAPAVVYWFQLVRHADKTVDFIPHLIDSDSGIGTQVLAADVTGDKLPDIIVGNKKGTFVHHHETKPVTKAEYEAAQPKVQVP